MRTIYKQGLGFIGTGIALYILEQILGFIQTQLVNTSISEVPRMIILDVAFFVITLIGVIMIVHEKYKKKPTQLEQKPELKKQIQEFEELKKKPFITKRDAKTLDWLDDVKTEVCVLAVDGGSFAESNFERIKKRINQDDVSFTFLLLNPSSDVLPKAEGTLLSPEAKIGIESQLKRFKNIRKELGNKMSKLEIKTYDLPIVHSIFIIDPKTNDGKMTVEYYEYKTEPRDKINVILTKKDNPELFEQYYNSYKYIFENSKTHIFEE